MKCGQCNATIAEKAIVCYRCGAPTAIPAAPRSTPPRESTRARGLALLGVGAVLAATAVGLPNEGVLDNVAGAGAGLSLVAGAYWTLRRK